MTGKNLDQWGAAYYLGALSPDDRTAYERYVGADQRRAALGALEFARFARILDALTKNEAALLAGIGDDVAGNSTATRRRKRPGGRVIAAAVLVAVALLCTGVLAGVTLAPGDIHPATATVPRLHAMRSTSGAISASLAITERSWGTRLDWICLYLQPWTLDVPGYDLVVTTQDGQQTRVASWRPAVDTVAGLAAATDIQINRIHLVDIRASGTAIPLAIAMLR